MRAAPTLPKLLMAALVCSSSSPAFAERPEALRSADVRRAASEDVAALIAAGERAHRLGKYAFAIHAFKQAHLTAPAPRLLLAIADAYHQRFAIKHAAYDRLQASSYYRAFLTTRPQGPQRARAQRLVSELEGKHQAADDDALEMAAARERGMTRLAITSSTMGSVVRIDGRKAQPLPLLSTIRPGKHRVVVSAPGHLKHRRRVTLVKGFVRALQVELEPQPAKLSLSTNVGAAIVIDSRFVGIAPHDKPFALDPGTRQVVVTLNGHVPYAERVTLKRGASRKLNVDLEMTGQRIGASLLLAAGGAGVATGIVFGVIATVEEQRPRTERDLARSDDLRLASATSAALGVGLSLVGGTLFVFDEPDLTAADGDTPARMNLSISPHGPGLVGATLRLRF